MNPLKITVVAELKVAISKAWEIYTQPAHITQWNFANNDWFCPSASNDLQVGGIYTARMEAKDGSFGFDFKATYTDIIDGQSFTYKLDDGRMVSVTFEKINELETRVIVVFDPENQNDISIQQQGWQAILDNYKKYSESLK